MQIISQVFFKFAIRFLLAVMLISLLSTNTFASFEESTGDSFGSSSSSDVFSAGAASLSAPTDSEKYDFRPTKKEGDEKYISMGEKKEGPSGSGGTDKPAKDFNSK